MPDNSAIRFNHRRIWQIALPMIVSNISTPLLGLADTAIMGHLSSPAYLGAVALGGIVFTFIYWGFGFLRMGATGLVAQSFGNGDYNEIRAIFGRSIVLALFLSAAILLLQYPIRQLFFLIIESNQLIETLADRYVDIRIWSAPATFINYVLVGLFLGLQNARYAMLVVILTNSINIILDILFVVLFEMGISGLALATVIGEFAGLIAGIKLLKIELRKYPGVYCWESMKNRTEIKRMLTANHDIFIRTLCLIFAFAFINIQSAKLGELILAANTVLLQFQVFMAYALDGFAHSAESLTGQALGKQDSPLMKQILSTSLFWSVITATLFSMTYYLIGEQLINLLTDLEAVRQCARIYLPWIVATPLVSVWCYWLDGVFIGATLTRQMRNAMLFSTFCGFLPAWYLTRSLENHGLWLTIIIFMIARAVSMFRIFQNEPKLGGCIRKQP